MDEQDDDAAMREMMGFGSFGSNKRQKLNTGGGNRPQKPPTTSSNSTPLGTSRMQPVPVSKGSSLSMVPSSLSPSGRSQPGSPVWNAAKLPNAVTNLSVAEVSDKDQSSAKVTNNDPILPSPEATNQATTDTQLPTLTSQPSDSSLKATAQAFTPTPSHKSASHFSASDIRSDPAYWTSTSAKQSAESEVGYTSKWTGATLTRKELGEYGRGKREVQEDGTMVSVFFKPGFLATQEELWGRWEREENAAAGVV